MKSFSNELKSVKASADKANEVGQKVIDGGHSSAENVKEKIQKMKKLFDTTENQEKEKLKKIRRSTKIFRRYGR